MENKILTLTKNYFDYFSSKDLKNLKNIYSTDTKLQDWTGTWFGIESVLTANEKLFENDFELELINSNQIDKTTYNLITIRFDNEVIDVLDIITFNDDNEIESIRAFKG